MAAKMSTNDKLWSILNGPDDNEDDGSATSLFMLKESEAKRRLRRTSMYNNGARSRIPKLRKSIETGTSPFALTDTKLLDLKVKVKPETTSVPPGAHDDQFRLVQSQTKKSLHDPDRVFVQTTTLNPSIRRVDQPPWYVGNNNKIVPPDSSMLIAASRYGYRGSRQIQQYMTAPYEVRA